MTLKQWSNKYRYEPTKMANGAVAAPYLGGDFGGNAHKDLFHLSDYAVSSVNAGTVWLRPLKVKKNPMGSQRSFWTYKGLDVFPADRNSSGINWYSRTGSGEGVLRSDTKDGMKQLINEYVRERGKKRNPMKRHRRKRGSRKLVRRNKRRTTRHRKLYRKYSRSRRRK